MRKEEEKKYNPLKSLLRTFDTKNVLYIVVGLILFVAFIIYQLIN